MKGLYLALFVVSVCIASCNSVGKCYYMDSITGDDGNNGNSPSQAWKSIERLNSVEFKPGDRIYFKSGTEYVGNFHPKGSGTPENPIVVDKFGKGENPILNGDGKELYTILLDGNVHWRLANLEIVNKGKEVVPGRKGIWIHVEKNEDAYHVVLHKLTIRDVVGDLEGEMPGGGIHVSSERDSMISGILDLTMDSCYIYRCRPWGVYVDAPESTVQMNDNFIR